MSAAALKTRLDRLENNSTGTVYSLEDVRAQIERISLAVVMEAESGDSPALLEAKARLKEFTARLAENQK